MTATYKFRHTNWDKAYYVRNLNEEAALVQREIEKLSVKRDMLQEFASRIDRDLEDA